MVQLAPPQLEDGRSVSSAPSVLTPRPTAAPPAPHMLRDDPARDWLCPIDREQQLALSDEELAARCACCPIAMYCGR